MAIGGSAPRYEGRFFAEYDTAAYAGVEKQDKGGKMKTGQKPGSYTYESDSFKGKIAKFFGFAVEVKEQVNGKPKTVLVNKSSLHDLLARNGVVSKKDLESAKKGTYENLIQRGLDQLKQRKEDKMSAVESDYPQAAIADAASGGLEIRDINVAQVLIGPKDEITRFLQQVQDASGLHFKEKNIMQRDKSNDNLVFISKEDMESLIKEADETTPSTSQSCDDAVAAFAKAALEFRKLATKAPDKHLEDTAAAQQFQAEPPAPPSTPPSPVPQPVAKEPSPAPAGAAPKERPHAVMQPAAKPTEEQMKARAEKRSQWSANIQEVKGQIQKTGQDIANAIKALKREPQPTQLAQVQNDLENAAQAFREAESQLKSDMSSFAVQQKLQAAAKLAASTAESLNNAAPIVSPSAKGTVQQAANSLKKTAAKLTEATKAAPAAVTLSTKDAASLTLKGAPSQRANDLRDNHRELLEASVKNSDMAKVLLGKIADPAAYANGQLYNIKNEGNRGALKEMRKDMDVQAKAVLDELLKNSGMAKAAITEITGKK